MSDPPISARVELAKAVGDFAAIEIAVLQIDAGYDTEIAVVDVLVVVVLDCMTLSPGQKVQAKRSMRNSRGGFSSLLKLDFEGAPRPSRFIGQSTWMSRTGSNRNRFGMRSRTLVAEAQPIIGQKRSTNYRH